MSAIASGEGEAAPAVDVYSLAATIYTLVAGRAPFEIVDGDFRAHDRVQVEFGNGGENGSQFGVEGDIRILSACR